MAEIEKKMKESFDEARVKELEKSLKEAGCKINRLQRTVSEMEASLEEQKTENAKLRGKIVKLVECYV